MMRELQRHALAVAQRMLGPGRDAEDVAQEAMLRLLQAEARGTTVVSPQAFATRTTVRLVVDRLRLQRRWQRTARHGATVVRVEAIRTPPDVEQLYAAITELPPRQAAVITLRKLLELDYVDVAAILGISVENCRSHCRLAMQRLRKSLIRDAHDPGGSSR